jgi:hypothetical protein
MPPWPPRVGLDHRIGVEATPGSQAHEQTDRQIRQREAELDRVIAGVEGEDRGTGSAGGRIHLLQPGADLLSSYPVDVLSRDDAPHVQRCRPTRAPLRHLHQPGVVPPRHNGLPMGMPVGVRVVPPLWTGALASPSLVRSARRRGSRTGHRDDTQTTYILAGGRLEALPFLACPYPEGCALELFLSTPPRTAACYWLKCNLSG